MCCESCFDCQEPCWNVNADIGNDPGPSVSCADTNFFLHTHTTPTLGIRNSNDGSKPADSRPPDHAGNSCHANCKTVLNATVLHDVQPAGTMRQDKQYVALPGEMPGDDHKNPWYAVED